MNWMADVLQVTPTEVVESPTRRRTSKICDNRLLLSTGYEFTYPTYREGYLEALKKVKQEIAEEKSLYIHSMVESYCLEIHVCGMVLVESFTSLVGSLI